MDISSYISIATGIVTILATVIAIVKSNEKIRTELEMKVKSQQYQLQEMKDDIKEHNNYAKEIPVIKTELKYITQMVGEIKNENFSHKQ